jgi:hypothetical protein
LPDDLVLLSERIRALLAAAADGSGRGLARSEVEPTLTEGYARALELDGECLRLETRIDRLTEEMAAGEDVPAAKLSGLLRRLNETEARSIELRELLAPLRRLVARAA